MMKISLENIFVCLRFQTDNSGLSGSYFSRLRFNETPPLRKTAHCFSLSQGFMSHGEGDIFCDELDK